MWLDDYVTIYHNLLHSHTINIIIVNGHMLHEISLVNQTRHIQNWLLYVVVPPLVQSIALTNASAIIEIRIFFMSDISFKIF